jgi:hypothetical protein
MTEQGFKLSQVICFAARLDKATLVLQACARVWLHSCKLKRAEGSHADHQEGCQHLLPLKAKCLYINSALQRGKCRFEVHASITRVSEGKHGPVNASTYVFK